MNKTTIYLPDGLQTRLNAEAAALGLSRAELIRRAIGNELDRSTRVKHTQPLPSYRSDRALTTTEQDDLITDQIAKRAARR